MKKTLLTSLAVIALGITSSHATESASDNTVAISLAGVSAESLGNLENCLNSDVSIAASKAIRACSKAYRASIPSYEVRSKILMRRGLLQLSAGRFDKASRDFKTAARLNKQNEFAYLGQGYAALLEKNYDQAALYFEDCKTHNQAAPLAMYGLGMAKEMEGDYEAALANYNKASDMRPEWGAPQAEIKRVKAKL